MNNKQLSRCRIALFGLGAAALVLSALFDGKHSWLSLLSLSLFVLWASSLGVEPYIPTALRRPPPSKWEDTEPTGPLPLDAAAQRTALGNAQEQLQVAIGHLARATQEPASVEDLAAARAWLRQIGAI